MNFLKQFQLLALLLSVVLAGCSVFKNQVKEEIAGTDDPKPYNWEVQVVVRLSWPPQYRLPSGLQTIYLSGIPLQIGGAADEPVVVTEKYEDYTSRQITELKARLLNSGRYLAVNCRKVPVTTE